MLNKSTNMSNYLTAIVFLFITIGLFIGAMLMTKADIYFGPKNEDECNKKARNLKK